jgi:hypothetical protein
MAIWLLLTVVLCTPAGGDEYGPMNYRCPLDGTEFAAMTRFTSSWGLEDDEGLGMEVLVCPTCGYANRPRGFHGGLRDDPKHPPLTKDQIAAVRKALAGWRPPAPPRGMFPLERVVAAEFCIRAIDAHPESLAALFWVAARMADHEGEDELADAYRRKGVAACTRGIGDKTLDKDLRHWLEYRRARTFRELGEKAKALALLEGLLVSIKRTIDEVYGELGRLGELEFDEERKTPKDAARLKELRAAIKREYRRTDDLEGTQRTAQHTAARWRAERDTATALKTPLAAEDTAPAAVSTRPAKVAPATAPASRPDDATLVQQARRALDGVGAEGDGPYEAIKHLHSLRLVRTPAATALLRRALAHPHEWVRARAIAMLVRRRDPAGKEALIRRVWPDRAGMHDVFNWSWAASDLLEQVRPADFEPLRRIVEGWDERVAEAKQAEPTWLPAWLVVAMVRADPQRGLPLYDGIIARKAKPQTWVTGKAPPHASTAHTASSSSPRPRICTTAPASVPH